MTIAHTGGQIGDVTRVTSPDDRWLEFTTDVTSRITQAKDNIGRTVAYTYDGNGNLSTVTDPENGVTTYTYDASNQLATIQDGRHIVYLTNQYVNGRIATQTLADPSAVYQFAYTLDGAGKITQTDITDPRGHIERLTFNADHYVVTDVEALGTPAQRTTTTDRQTGSNLVTAVIDGLGRRTQYTYDTAGHVLTTTRLAGTADAATTTYTYEPRFNQVATVSDPLHHTWTLGYDARSRPVSVTDPLTHQSTIGWNAFNQVTSVTDALQHTSQLGYTSGDLTTVTNPLNAVQRQFVDGAGRVVATTDPLGRTTRMTVDKLNRTIAVTDPQGGQTSFTYDGNSNLLSLTDPLTHATSYTYDTSDRVAARTDPLTHVATYAYDTNGNPTQETDRKGQITGRTYDALDRPTLVTFHDASTIAYTYDAGNRVTQIVDSANGTITRGYDLLDRLTSETTPEGSLSYTYDADGRRATMTVAGQPAVTYGYDDVHRLTSITQGTSVVALAYDDADRRTTLTLPNGVVTTYGYDNANQLTGLTYTLGATTLGTLTYAYDAGGNRTTVGGTWARTGLPQTVASATYDAANRIATWAGQPVSYDANGNLASDGLTSYVWNARNQLAAISGATGASFAYDAMGQRRARTTSGSTSYLYDGANAAQELVGGSPTATVLAGGVDEVFQRTDASGTRAVLTDALGSTVALVDGAGAVQTQYTYEPFGATARSGAASGNPAQFTGRENDGTGLYYYRARYYDPRLQRFISEDPIGFGGGDVNLHAYTFNAPTKFRDPSGRFVVPLILCAAGAGGSAAGDWMSGRKFDPVKAAAWCAAGLTLGVAGPAIAEALGYGASALLGGAAAGVGPRVAQNLAEQLTLAEAMGGSGERIMEGAIKDPSFPEDLFAKIQHVHVNPDGTKIVIHYWQNLVTGETFGFKFK